MRICQPADRILNYPNFRTGQHKKTRPYTSTNFSIQISTVHLQNLTDKTNFCKSTQAFLTEKVKFYPWQPECKTKRDLFRDYSTKH